MIILYLLLVAYILAVNFYAFLLVKSLKAKEKAAEAEKQASERLAQPKEEQRALPESERASGKLCVTGLLGGAVTIYACMFLFKYRRNDLLLMVLMPLLGVLNIYLWVVLFRSGFTLFLWR